MEAIFRDYTSFPQNVSAEYIPTDDDIERPCETLPSILSTEEGVRVTTLVRWQLDASKRLGPDPLPPTSPSNSRAAKFISAVPLEAFAIAQRVRCLANMDTFGTYILMARLTANYIAAKKRLLQSKNV